jgi:MoxR-like ATPase
MKIVNSNFKTYFSQVLADEINRTLQNKAALLEAMQERQLLLRARNTKLICLVLANLKPYIEQRGLTIAGSSNTRSFYV